MCIGLLYLIHCACSVSGSMPASYIPGDDTILVAVTNLVHAYQFGLDAIPLRQTRFHQKLCSFKDASSDGSLNFY